MLCAPKGCHFTGSWSCLKSSAKHTLSNKISYENQLKCSFDQQVQLKQLRLLIKQKMMQSTLFKLLAGCYISGFAMTYCWLKQSMCNQISNLFSEKIILNGKTLMSFFNLFHFIIVSRENELLCCLVSMKY